MSSWAPGATSWSTTWLLVIHLSLWSTSGATGARASACFFATPAYQLNYALNAYVEGNGGLLWGLYLPNLLCGFGSLVVMALGAKKTRPSYTAYFLAYFAMSTGITWLLSAPRYLAVCFPLAFAAGALFCRRGGRIAAAVLSFCLMLLYLRMYVLGFPVY